jgi:DNA-binding NarL/FixJ family response regulator
MSLLENEWSKVLSPREREIALLVGRGLSNKDVARELGLSPGTVKIHLHSIFMKLGERSRQRLIVRQAKTTIPALPDLPMGINRAPGISRRVLP